MTNVLLPVAGIWKIGQMSNGTVNPYQVSDYGQFALIVWCGIAGAVALVSLIIFFAKLFSLNCCSFENL